MGSNKKIITIIIAVTVLIVAVASIWLNRPPEESRGIDYFYEVLNNSSTHYKEELALLNNNPVFRQAREGLAQSSSHVLKLENGEITINNDTENKILSGVVTLDRLPISIDFFMTDEKLIVGSEMLIFLEADINNLVEDITTFTNNNGLQQYNKMIETVLTPLDLSYSYLTSFDVAKPFVELEPLLTDYKDIFKKLFNESSYSHSETEDELTSVEIITDNETFLNWLANDFAPKAKNDSTLKSKMYSLSVDYEKFIAELDNFITAEAELDIVFRFEISDSIISSVSVGYGSGENIAHIEISALGEENRIDDFAFSFRDKNEDIKITAIGNHINSDIFSSEITFLKNGKLQGAVTALWDSNENTSGFTIVPNWGIMTLAYPQGNRTVTLTLSADKYIPITSWEIYELENPPKLPETTEPVRDATLLSLMGKLGELLRYIPLF